MKEEQSYNRLKEIEDLVENYAAHLNNTGILDEVLREVASAADQLESRIGEHIVNGHDLSNGGQIEAVMHIREKENGEIDYEILDENEYEIDSGKFYTSIMQACVTNVII